MKKRAAYTKDLPHRIYTYFIGFGGIGAPSISKFAREVGLTVADIERFRGAHSEFERACRECNEIRRDYLIDNALAKKNDSSLTKFLLASEFGMGEDAEVGKGERLEVTVEVVGE